MRASVRMGSRLLRFSAFLSACVGVRSKLPKSRLLSMDKAAMTSHCLYHQRPCWDQLKAWYRTADKGTASGSTPREAPRQSQTHCAKGCSAAANRSGCSSRRPALTSSSNLCSPSAKHPGAMRQATSRATSTRKL
eukprot:1592902-Lingulodinium_polyedra.AAC.1